MTADSPSLSACPRPDDADAIDRDVHDATRRRVVERREAHGGTEVDVRELLKQLWSATGSEPGRAMDHQVLPEPRRLDLGSLDRQRDPRVTLDVPHLLAVAEVCENDLVTVEAHPHNRDLRRTIGIHGHEVREAARLDQGTRGLRNRGHGATLKHRPYNVHAGLLYGTADVPMKTT
jgi:hypothetical protein